VEKVLHRGQSAFQKVEVVKTKPFGRLLITDGLMQSSEEDEYVYHQSLVHPAMTAHPNPKKVFIAGGGEVRFDCNFLHSTRFSCFPAIFVVST
jgi:spermidine synthase